MPLPTPTIKIIITEAQPLLLHGIVTSLAFKEDIEIIAVANNREILFEKLEDYFPDIILLNSSISVMNGDEILALLKEKYPSIKVIIYGMSHESEEICHMLEQGAITCLTKDCTPENFYETILLSHKNWFYINDTVREAISQIKPPPEVPPFGPPYQFAVRDSKIYKLLKAGKSSLEIGKQIEMDYRIVDSIIENLKRQTKSRNTEALLKYAEKNKLMNP